MDGIQKTIVFISALFVLFITAPIVKVINDTVTDNYSYTWLLAMGGNTTLGYVAATRMWPWIVPILGIVILIILFFRREEPEPLMPMSIPRPRMPSIIREPVQPKVKKQVKLRKTDIDKDKKPPLPPLFFGGSK